MNSQKKPDLPSWLWALIGGGLALILALTGLGLWNFIDRKNSSISEAEKRDKNASTSLVSNAEELLAKKLIGQWEALPPNKATIFFTPDSRFLVGLSETEADEAASYYRVDSTSQANYLVLYGLDETQSTWGIFDFTVDGKLKFEINNEKDRPRATSFSNRALLFQKVSETIPANMKIRTLEEKVGQSEGVQYIASINKGQQGFYVYNGKFSDSIEDLEIGIKTETSNYSYRIIFLEPLRMVQMVAVPKKRVLKSYTGIVHVKETTGSTVSVVCASNEPTMQLPSQPEFTSNGAVVCPSGYSMLR